MILLERAIKYAEDVANGNEVTTWEVKKQCEIFLNDYNNRQYNEDFEFCLDENKLQTINDLLKLLNFATGFVAGKEVLECLAPFQAFFYVNIFGWRFKTNKDKFRYSDVTLFIARKNSKTATIAIVFILLMFTEQNYSEFYSICLTKELASEIKKIMAQIINASPLIKNRFFISTTKTGQIKCSLTDSYFEPRVAEAGKNNSIRPSAFVSDEHANFTENSNFSAMRSGQKNVINPLVFRTTTAYAIDNSIMEEDLEYIRKVYNNVIDAERMFALVYYAEKDHIWDDIGLYQANPLRVEENYKTMREDRKKALVQPNLQEEFITKTCNVFMQSKKEEKYLDIALWKKCCVEKVDFTGRNVVVGVDLSISTDLTAVSIMYKEKDKYYLYAKGFLPAATLAQRREKIDYRHYQRMGYCEIQEGYIVDYNQIEEYIRNIEKNFQCKIKCIVSDPFNAMQMMQNLANDYEVIMLKQTYTALSGTIKSFRDEVYKGNVIYQENKLLDWCVSNAVEVRAKVTEDILLAKENKNKQRIDLLMSSIFTHNQLYLEEQLPELTEDYIKSFYS